MADSNIVVLTRPDGTAEFDCLDCGANVHRFACTDEANRSPVCLTCQEIRRLRAEHPDDPKVAELIEFLRAHG